MTEKRPYISIITPSLNMLPYLKCCVASVSDQNAADFEHIIIDGGSIDKTKDWLLSNNSSTQFIIEKDKGMYDALNKGLLIAQGDIIGYLNCDEQYLPGTLSYVQSFFSQNDDVDILFGSTLLTKSDGSLIAHRKAYKARWSYIASGHLYLHSCSTFWRKRLQNDGYFFNASFKSAGDADYIVRILRAGYRSAFSKKFLAIFTMTGQNLGETDKVIKESKMIMNSNPKWIKFALPVLLLARCVEKFVAGGFSQQLPICYQIYVGDNLERRKAFKYSTSSFRWKRA